MYRGEMIGGKDRQAPVDESIMPMPQGFAPQSSWMQTGTTWQDIIDLEASQWEDVSPPSTPLLAKS